MVAIDAALHGAGIAPSLRAALEALEGPLVERAAVEAGWLAVAAGTRHPVLAAFLKTAAGLGLLKRLARQDATRAARLRDGTDSVLDRLPAAGLPRAQLAAETLGDAHALDGGQPVATLALAAWRGEDPRPAERVRDQWARLGVLVNELARPALFLNLPGAPPGEPAYASLRLLLRTPPAWPVAGRTVHVCENPNLLSIVADRLGAAAPPLVCTDGMPAAAQRTLLANWRLPGRAFATTATSTGPASPSPTTSCAPTAPGPGASARRTTARPCPPPPPDTATGCPARRWRPHGIPSSPRPCRKPAWPWPRKAWPRPCWPIWKPASPLDPARFLLAGQNGHCARANCGQWLSVQRSAPQSQWRWLRSPAAACHNAV